MSGKHTPVPWFVGEGNFIEDEQGNTIADPRCMNPTEDHEEMEANAEFIVRAVNCHDELVAQLERMCTYYEPGETRPEAVGKIKAARAILAKSKVP